MTITEFLLERIAEDEAAARAVAQGERWWVDGPAEKSGQWWIYDTESKFPSRETALHVARHDPARVLVECAAKRAIIGEHEIVQKPYLKDYCSTCADWDNAEVGEGPPNIEWPCPSVRALAAVYAAHPAYQQEWVL